ncbi:MAG: aminotransferase class I/II-fold pyridoxal phosphate-dependent enzyme [Ruminococcaceae bacterium]|nr:aminotransferase class I/II-fold pyridoxal phosphate-dependent enzyme [Oscillospiraceae bacterium]
MNYINATKNELKSLLDSERKKYDEIISKKLSLNMSRGRPCTEQLDLTEGMLSVLYKNDMCNLSGNTDVRNYGVLSGIDDIKTIFAPILGADKDEIFVGGNSSLNLMYDMISDGMLYGYNGCTPWAKLENVKFLCPVPGYDRHFMICEKLGIEMVNVDMLEDGPDMDTIEKLISEDDSIKGIWCVPKYSNPQGITYSDEVVRRFADLSPKAPDFKIFWDNAYAIHDLDEEKDVLLGLLHEAVKNGKEDMVFEFTSTSKITYAGAGVSFLASSVENIKNLSKRIGIRTIGYDKVNQLRHALFFKTTENVYEHMKLHAEILRPKFDIVVNTLESELGDTGIASWHRPRGGYFVSLELMHGTAKRAWQLANEAGVVLTTVGATYPYGRDPKDSNIRIAPSNTTKEELTAAMDVLCVCAKIAAVEKLLEA